MFPVVIVIAFRPSPEKKEWKAGNIIITFFHCYVDVICVICINMRSSSIVCICLLLIILLTCLLLLYQKFQDIHVRTPPHTHTRHKQLACLAFSQLYIYNTVVQLGIFTFTTFPFYPFSFRKNTNNKVRQGRKATAQSSLCSTPVRSLR